MGASVAYHLVEQEGVVKKLSRWLLSWGLGLLGWAFGSITLGQAEAGIAPVLGCDGAEFTRLEQNFRQMTEIRARWPSVFSAEEYQTAALAYLDSSEKCFHAMVQADTDPIIIDEGGLSPYAGVIGPLFNTNGLKWGANSPYNPSGQNAGGPGTPGGTVTYSYMATGISHGVEAAGSNTDVRTISSVSSCAQTEIAAAFAAWSAIADIHFVEVADSNNASNTPELPVIFVLAPIRLMAHLRFWPMPIFLR